MRYDPDNNKYFWSEEMVLSEQGKADYAAYSSKFNKIVRNDPFGTYLKTLDVREEGKDKKKIGLILGGIVFAGIIGAILSAVIKRFDIAGWIVACVFVIVGLAMLISPVSRAFDNVFAGNSVMTRIKGVVHCAGAAAIIFVQLNASSFVDSKYPMMLGFVVAATLAVSFAFSSIELITGHKNVYTEEVEAQCIGYIRTHDSYGSEYVVPSVSPVFEYHYGGQKYKACYDVFEPGLIGKIPAGSNVKIKIDPGDPESVMGDHKENIVPAVLATLVLLACALVLGYLVFFV